MGKIVGILSMHKVYNYGSFLQAYALKQLLLQNGAEKVYFIDIKPGKQLEGYVRPSKLGRVYTLFTYLLKGTLFKRFRYGKFIDAVNKSIEKNFSKLGIYEHNPNPNHYDLVVIGSDEVFHCCQVSSWGYTKQLFGYIPEADKVISYAGSFGHTTLEKLQNLGVASEIGDTMKTMHAISVRDTNSRFIVSHLVGKEPLIHLDPVLTYDYSSIIDKYNRFMNDKYIVIYTYADRIKDSDEICQITSFAHSKGLKIVCIFCNYEWGDHVVIPDTPFDVLGWFKGAEYVVTDTFHGTIFSIITKRQFCTLVRDNNSEKLQSLLKTLALASRASKRIADTLLTPIDYNKTFEVLQKERIRSNSYLRENLCQ